MSLDFAALTADLTAPDAAAVDAARAAGQPDQTPRIAGPA